MQGKKRYKKIRKDAEFEAPEDYLARVKYEEMTGINKQKEKEEQKNDININKVVVMNESYDKLTSIKNEEDIEAGSKFSSIKY